MFDLSAKRRGFVRPAPVASGNSQKAEFTGRNQPAPLARVLGNQALAGLAVSSSNDRYEHAAEQNATQVMRGQSANPGGHMTGSGPNTAISGGRPMPVALRDYFEPRFGQRFHNVRIHDGPAAADTAGHLNARAFTAGNHLFFNRGEYQPQSAAGKRLLAHELSHVVQQRADSRPRIQRQAIPGAAGQQSQGSPYTFIGCTDDEYRILDHTIRQSYLMVRHAGHVLLNYIYTGGTDVPDRERSVDFIGLRARLLQDFAARNLSQAGEIRENYMLMLHKMRGGLTIECHHDPARNQVAEAETPGNKIWVGPRFFTQFDDELHSRPRVFIHELAHNVGLGHEFTGVAYDAATGREQPGEFAHHADSYATLAYRIFTGNFWARLGRNSDI